GGAQALDQLAGGGLAERLGDLRGEDRADARHRLDLLGGGFEEGVDGAEVGGQVACVDPTDAVDAEPEEDAVERLGLRPLDRVDEVARRVGAEALELDEAVGGEVVDAGDAVDDAFAEELQDALLAKSLDVHRAAAGELL